MKTITKNDFEKLFNLCRSYDPFTMYIDSYEQEIQAEKANKKIMEKFSNIVKENYNIEIHFMPPYRTTVEYPIAEARVTLEKWLSNNGVKIIENPKRVWTTDDIKRLLQTNDTMLYRSLKILYSYQTADEKSTKDTITENGVGFNSVDAQFLSSCAEFLIKNGFLTIKQKTVVRTKMIKYTKQLTKLANKCWHLKMDMI